MERILITVGNKKDLINFEECVITQNEWAEKHNIQHSIVELNSSENQSWAFYKTFISYLLENEDKIVMAIMPHVMILESFNPLFIMGRGIAANVGQTSFIMGKSDGSDFTNMILKKSLNFREVKNTSCNLALEVLSLKINNFVYFIQDLVARPNYTRVIQEKDTDRTGFELHADTNKNGQLKIAYNRYDSPQIYKGGEFAVDLNLNNLDLSKGFITEFKKLKSKILETTDQLQEIYKDINT